MAITSTTFNYPVAKIIDTPWNTIINGLNYTKTNLTPLGLRYTEANNYDNGMLLKEFAGNSPKENVPIIDYSFNAAIQDYSDLNKYWIINSTHLTEQSIGPAIYCATKAIDTNGFEYSILTDANKELTRFISNGYFVYQDASVVCAVLNASNYSGSTGSSYIYRFLKNGNMLEILNTLSFNGGTLIVLKVENGYIYCFTTYRYLSGKTTYIRHSLYKIEIASFSSTQLWTKQTEFANLHVFPSNVLNDNSFYVNIIAEDKWLNLTINPQNNGVEEIELVLDKLTNKTAIGRGKQFVHVYESNNSKFLAVITLKSYAVTIDNPYKATIQLYSISDTNLQLKQEITLDAFSLIPKDNWNTLFIGTSSGLQVYSWDNLTNEFIEKPAIVMTLQEFGFDLDERLWILDTEGNVFRYTYNQPVIVDYKFEKESYLLEKDPLETYVKVRVLNYSGKYISSKLILKAFGNFTFENNKKELEITLSSTDYISIPVYLVGAGKYEIRL